MDAYASFYTTNKDRIFGFLLRLTGDYHLADELMQESFARYLNRYGKKGHNRALLYTIARNAALDAMRRRREEPWQGDGQASSDGDPECRLIEKESYGRIMAAMGRLKLVDRELLALLATETFTYREIGEQLQISEANVKVRVHRARLRLKAILEKGGP